MKDNSRMKKYIAVILTICMLPFHSFNYENSVYAMQTTEEIEQNKYVEERAKESEENVSDNEAKIPLQNFLEADRDIIITEDFVLTESISINSLTIESGNLDLNGKTLTIEKDFIQASGELVINNGSLIVKGDYHQQKQDGEGAFGIGSGTLVMNQPEDYVLIYGDMYVETTEDTRGKLTDGVLEIKGSFFQKNKAYYNFVSQENHTLKLSGDKLQTVYMEWVLIGDSQLNHVEILNTSKEGVVFENRPIISGRITDYKNSVSGEIGILKSTQIGQGHFGGSIYFLEGYVLKQGVEWEIEGNVSISYNLDIQGILRVRGDVVLSNGYYTSAVRMQKGQLLIAGDLVLKGSPTFYMTNEEDYVTVGGNFTSMTSALSLSAGNLEVKGDFNATAVFTTTGTHKTILSGNKKQTVNLKEGSYFQTLELQNYSHEGVYSAKTIQKKEFIRNNCKLVYGGVEGVYGYTLTADETVSGNLVLLDDVLDLNGNTLHIQGDLVQTSGEICINNGTLIVDGDYRQQSPSGDEYSVGSGSIRMNQPQDHVLIYGDMYVETDADTRGKMTEGVLELKGDFVQKKSASRYSFVAQGNHKLLLSGEGQQMIAMEDSAINYSALNHIELINQSEEGICFENRPYIGGIITDHAKKVYGQIGVSVTTQFVDNYFGGSIYTLQAIQIKADQEWTIGGDLVVAGSLTINGKVHVKGNVQIGANNFYYCEIIMQSGSLYIDGNLDNTNTSNRGNLYMKSADAYVLVGGNFVFYPTYRETFQAGILEVKGDFTTGSTFAATGSHKLLLSGDKKQTITTKDGAYFNIIELKNNSLEGVYSEKILLKQQLIRNGCKLVYGELSGSFGYTLNADETISGNFLLIDETLDLNGYTLRVKGNLIQAAGEIKLNGGTLIVEGDYRQQVPQGESYSAGKGFITMTGPEDKAVIQGDMYVETQVDTRGKLTDGILELQGDFIQIKSTNQYSFVAEGNHKILLSGSGKQNINMEDTAVYYSGLNHVEINNQSEEGVVFENRPFVKGKITDNAKKIAGEIGISSTTSLTNGYFGGSIYMLQSVKIKEGEEWIISGDIEVAKDLSIYGNLYVRGDVIMRGNQNYYGITMCGGSLTVDEDLNEVKTNYIRYLKMTNVEDYILVKGNVNLQFCAFDTLSAGVLEVKGDFNANYQFKATSTHKIILSGDRLQTVTLEEGAYFNILELRNYSEEGIYSKKPISRAKFIRNGCKLTYEGMEGTYGYTLKADEVISEDFILLDDTLNLNGHTLHIKGNFIQPAGEIVLNGGKLIVEGDFRQQSIEGDDYGEGSGSICMNQPDDYMLIYGDMYVETNTDTRDKMTDGTLELKGSFVQKKTLNRYNFVPKGNHKLLLSGSNAQTVCMEDTIYFWCINNCKYK